MSENPYRDLAERLNALPNGFPATEDGIELKLLAKIFTPEEATLAAQLRLTKETPAQIAARLGRDAEELRPILKNMARRGLIAAGSLPGGTEFGFGLLPFVVGIYEMQNKRLDAEMATLFEEYYQRVFGKNAAIQPSFHRVIPVRESVRTDLEVHPFESAADIVRSAQAWGVLDCICRKQKQLIGDPCGHPVDICMTFGPTPGMFDGSSTIHAQTLEEALATLQRAADAGLVHTVNNIQQGNWYICNCCTCSCAILRGIKEMGIANVVARSAFVNTVDAERCIGCETCLDYCQFDALSMGEDDVVLVNATRCVGCGVCASHCADEALILVRRPAEEIKAPPMDEAEWLQQRATTRGIDLRDVL